MSLFDIVELEKSKTELENQIADENFWQKDSNETAKILAELKQHKTKIDNYRNICNEISEIEDLTELAELENDESFVKDIY